jgi:hypothetical protein
LVNGFEKMTKARICVGLCALVWAIWNYWNDIIFNKANRVQFSVNKTTYWINMWSYLFSEEQRVYMDTGCTRLMAVIRAIFSRGGWHFTSRL